MTSLTSADIREHIREYASLLDSSCDERPIHRFLAKHSYFFAHLLRTNVSPLYSKIKLGNEFEVDFATFDKGSVGPEWYLIEIESPTCKMFTKAGRQSAKLTHAIQQIADWRAWVQENLGFARKLIPYIDHPLGYLFMGRRHALNQAERTLLRKIIMENRLLFRIHSLDQLVDWANDVLRFGKNGMSVQMKALTHRDLRKGLPPNSQWYMDNFVAGLIKLKRYPKEMLEERRYHKIDLEREGV